MLSYIVRRLLYMLVLLWTLSILTFFIIQLPPGDYLTTVIEGFRQRGIPITDEMVRSLEARYGLNLPIYLDEEVRSYLQERAKSKGVEVAQLVNEMLRQDIKLIEAVK